MKKEARIVNSSEVLSLAILHANIEIKVTNSQFCIIDTSIVIICKNKLNINNIY